MHLRLFSLSALLLVAPAVAQEATTTNAAGGVYEVSYITNARGATTATSTLLTISTAPTQAQGGNVAVNGAATSLCTTAGCPIAPTVYTQSGVVVTWTATTPTTPIPTWSSSGSVLGISQYITTTMTASGLVAGAARGGSFPFVSDRGVMGLVALVGGLVGAAVLL
ncbi:hypothetical protein RQP46_007163 [Phenoliferia psychrophenolica]